MKKATRRMAITLFSLSLLAITTLPAWAKPKMEVQIIASKVVVESINGTEVSKNVPVQVAESGDTLTFTVTYKNSGNETATNAVINNPISDGMSYIDNSVTGQNSDISFSIDGGKNFKKPSYLTYEVKLPGGGSEKHTARPEEYTDIRWTLKSVPVGSSGTLSYKTKVK
jgi:uncharacterized repeat protein (TIGR01451 family)